jgi:RNA polymerase sigma-70 factor (ECF subfamily)
MTGNANEDAELLRHAAGGDQGAWDELLSRHRPRLLHIVTVRLDRRVQARIDPSDVLQEAFLAAFRCAARYLQDPEISVFVWLRAITLNKLRELHRHQLVAGKRDARRDVSLFDGSPRGSSSAELADYLVASTTGPGTAAERAEKALRVRKALEGLDPLDRESLVLRHFEQLSSSEAAQVLGIEPPAARKRYQRALKRIKDVLPDL